MELPDVCVAYLLRTAHGRAQVLLGHKRTGLGRGKVVGVGGKIEAGESVRDAAVREIAEEIGVRVDAARLRSAGVIDYHFPSRPEWSQRSHVFTCTEWEGEPSASTELEPAWFDVHAVPYERMWDDASRWLPDVLGGGSVRADYTFGDDLATVVTERRRADSVVA